ncbi:hypothetical protein Esti_004734 [Eimeria stiedai]
MNCLRPPAAAAAAAQQAAPREPMEIMGRHGRDGFNPYVNNGGWAAALGGAYLHLLIANACMGEGLFSVCFPWSVSLALEVFCRLVLQDEVQSMQKHREAQIHPSPFQLVLFAEPSCVLPAMTSSLAWETLGFLSAIPSSPACSLRLPSCASCSPCAAAAAVQEATLSSLPAASPAAAALLAAAPAPPAAAAAFRTSRCGIASSGMQADILTLHKVLKTRVALFKHQHREEPSVVAVAQLLSTILYSRRFFPYYTFNVIFGLDSEGLFNMPRNFYPMI